MRWLLLGILLTFTGCGGGSSGVPNSGATVPVTSTRFVHYGYFGDTCNVPATAHASFQMLAGWCTNGVDIVSAAVLAQARGQKLVLLPPSLLEADLVAMLDSLRAANVLKDVLAIYPVDEPDALGMSDLQIRALAANVRRVAATYPELANVQLWTIYGQYGTPAADVWDACGHDDYGRGPQEPSGCKRLILIPGGAAPWREDPQAFVAEAEANPNVVAVMPFIWNWPGKVGDGIADSYIAPKYVAAGCQLTEKSC